MAWCWMRMALLEVGLLGGAAIAAERDTTVERWYLAMLTDRRTE